MRSSMIVFRAVADKFPDKNVKYLEQSIFRKGDTR